MVRHVGHDPCPTEGGKLPRMSCSRFPGYDLAAYPWLARAHDRSMLDAGAAFR